MRLSVERLRWGLLAGALLLVGVLVVLLSYGRYLKVMAYKQFVKRSGATITHDADGVTWSQALGNKQIFTLHAKHVEPHGAGRYTVQNGTLVLYGPNGEPAYRISGAQFDYDQKAGIAKALGEVDMQLELPKALSGQRGSSGTAPGPKAPRGGGIGGDPAQVVHVRTSGLTYVKKLGVAATDQEVEIEYGGMHGWAKGAEFDTGESVVHLLADVRAQGTLRGADKKLGGALVTLTATKADLDRKADVIELTAPRMESRGRVATAAEGVLHLREGGSLETVEARGAVKLVQGTRTITARALHAAMNENSQMEHAELTGGVALVDTSAVRPMKGSAKTVNVMCDGVGNPTSIVLEGGATISAETMTGGRALQRQMGADRMTLTLVKAEHGARGGRTRVSAVHAEGNAWASGDGIERAGSGKGAGAMAAGSETAGLKTAGLKTAGLKTTRISADDLRLALARDAAGKDEPESLKGDGHTRIEQRLADGSVRTSSGESVEATFGPGKNGSGVEIASAEQTGHVVIQSAPGKEGEAPGEGVAERASLDGATDVLTLTSPQGASSSGTPFGHPRLTRGDTSVSAGTIRLTQTTGDAVAEGGVEATLVNAKAGKGSPVTHVLAQQAMMKKAEQTVEFMGTDAAPVRMWQGASQVEAANLLLDRAKDSMQAWPASPNGVVRAVFAGEGGEAKAGADKAVAREGSANTTATSKNGLLKLKGDKVVRVTSARLDYSGASHEAVFTGGVVAQGEDAQVRAQRGVAFLTPKQQLGAVATGVKAQPDPVAASVEKIVMSGAVRVEEPGRVGTGEQLLYTAATGEFVLTGTEARPPHMVDEKQGSITGATLLFREPDSTIIVAGGPASRRVHTETTIRK